MKIFKLSYYSDLDEYRFHTTCANSTYEKIVSMIDHPDNKELSYNEFIEFVSEDQLEPIFDNYDWSSEDGLKMKDDYSVSFYKSVYEGYKCVYVRYSSIEFIFLSNEEVDYFSQYKGYSEGDNWIVEDEKITTFYKNDNGKVYVLTDETYWYDFEEEIKKENNFS